MTVVGIDGSTKKTGITVMIDGKIKDYKLIDISKEQDAMQRMFHMMSEIAKFLDKFEIDGIYMEKAFQKSNVATTMKLANIAGAIMMYCSVHNIQFYHPLPSEWRSKIGIEQGSKVTRNTLKAEAIKAVQQEYNITVGDDVAESILLARSAFNLPKINITEDDIWD